METSLSKADPTALVVSTLSSDLGLQALGAAVGAEDQPPYPTLVVSDPPGGSVGRGYRLISTLLLVEALGDPDRRIERARIKAVAYRAQDVLRGLPDLVWQEGDPVVTEVTMTAPGWSPRPNRQGRYLFRATVHSHE